MYAPLFLIGIDESYKGLARYIETVQASADRWHRRDTARIRKRSPADSEEQELLELMNDEFHGEVLPRLFPYSCVLALSSLNEASVITLCRVVDRRLGHRQAVKLPQRLADCFPGTAFNYLGEVFNRTPELERFQGKLAALEHIRNCIAHCDGIAARSRHWKAVEQAAKQFGFLLPHKGEGHIKIPAKQLLALVGTCKSGFDAVYKTMHPALRDATPVRPRVRRATATPSRKSRTTGT